MTEMLIELKNASTTVDLSLFKNLNEDSISWGDDTNITYDTFIHTYQNPGLYRIVANFENVSEIYDNFTINNLSKIDLSNFTNLNIIGENFLQNTSIKYLDLSNLSSLSTIKNGFLKNCQYINTILLNNNIINLLGWGDNIGSNIKIYVDPLINIDYVESNWDTEQTQIFSYDIEYNTDIDKTYAKIMSFGNYNFIHNNMIDLSKTDNLREAINNHTILLQDTLEGTVDPDTRRIYYDDELLNKCKFVFQYKYLFKDNPYDEDSEEYTLIYTRLLIAKNVINNKLLVETIDGIVYYDNEVNTVDDFKDNHKEYLIPDAIDNYNDSHIYKFETNILPFEDCEEPPYCRGHIMFGKIDSNNATNILYNGEANTGFQIEIKVNGICKNIYIYDLDVDPELGRRKYIKINTDKLPEGKLLRGDYININTKLGEKHAYLERLGEKIDIMKYIDRSSSWLEIYKGDNYFYATADEGEGNGSIYNVKINISYNELYEGI